MRRRIVPEGCWRSVPAPPEDGPSAKVLKEHGLQFLFMLFFVAAIARLNAVATLNLLSHLHLTVAKLAFKAAVLILICSAANARDEVLLDPGYAAGILVRLRVVRRRGDAGGEPLGHVRGGLRGRGSEPRNPRHLGTIGGGGRESNSFYSLSSVQAAATVAQPLVYTLLGVQAVSDTFFFLPPSIGKGKEGSRDEVPGFSPDGSLYASGVATPAEQREMLGGGLFELGEIQLHLLHMLL